MAYDLAKMVGVSLEDVQDKLQTRFEQTGQMLDDDEIGELMNTGSVAVEVAGERLIFMLQVCTEPL